MKLIESPLDVAALPLRVVTFRWDTGEGEIWIEITPTDTGIELYCDGEGCAELNYTDNECINAMTIQPELSER